MQIGVLTQPLHNNYGGLLQNYALQTVLKGLGHSVWTIDRNYPDIPAYRKYGSLLKRIVTRQRPLRSWLTQRENQIISLYTQRFVQEYIQHTSRVTSTQGMIDMQCRFGFDTYVVGSDQVWRPRYSPCITNYFLDFTAGNTNVRKIAYAASFGVDEWEFTPEQTAVCKPLAQQFHAVSVREDSAVDLCRQYLGINSIHTLDPTLLLSQDDYETLVIKKNIPTSKGNLFTYILDITDEKKNLVGRIAEIKKLRPFEVMPEKDLHEARKNELEKCVFPPVEQWLRAFMDADFILTDSFHGTVFSILFGKPFLTIGNRERGLTRMASLLKMLQLENRLIIEKEDFDDSLLQQSIDYSIVHPILFEKRKESIRFLKDGLKQ